MKKKPTTTAARRLPPQHTNLGWRSKALNRMKDLMPQLTRFTQKKTKKARRALLNVFENQRKDILKGLREEESSSDTITNLQALLSLPLELQDLESCLHNGVAGAICKKGTNERVQLPFNLSEIDADAEFLAKFVQTLAVRLALAGHDQDKVVDIAIRFIAIARVEWASWLIEPKLIAPVLKRLTISTAGSTSSSGMACSPGLNSIKPRIVSKRSDCSLTLLANSS